ncbi:tRNA glutamyl-Q(34) synthetase GluQRS [Photobacterium phosphoreum]|jgi:glutamyl-Q tRNA(Asp) synthetase|uniref:Glutamyl-Q tRNA(Asp) synthetase n=1 Tax=Photobacterium phosphoreum TaxID=659 RepID=A0AAW4ZYV6_PHOPO|nr:tRNA glutamyl-Q(34) synthetase GluQRS [Photobacterium phosphoreum]MCD9464269.1 tRNA glutamyl-Q(34) synthetase GluQRS [Photobacterium phosphoreum]MCD9472247.1 tRNA glutamyl-Q(34) synthetase GluQRS [Photobacterium phosphoreum]MCD9477220.1 tRNA glutamyl-Q(34) synthetase GluQRS [Photobacterium phosphoreum]MCD9479829.1 tRNA glutamyl-Q(34) synthetase GluQRS [Photobacterium phosphoreum]MCD9484337.1 tRNA glutamyl-Q(34) synthetase GluQRS [Photobacterium phosphoreum]
MTNTNQYVGRFAPSPSGPLHFGSLIAALGSYLQAKSQQGKWIVRIEDLDPPREMLGAANDILRTLEAFGFMWDGDIMYQSLRHDAYHAQIDAWLAQGNAYYCQCSRKDIKQTGGFYPGTCRTLNQRHSNGAVRLQVDTPITHFDDLLHGHIELPFALAREDFIIRRRDGLFAYNLAVVLDDIEQGITEVVRGADLIEPTGRQIGLYRQLGHPEVSYLHLPLAITDNGNKLSKQNHAPAIDKHNPRPALMAALRFLGFSPPTELVTESVEQILQWGITHWQLKQLPKTTAITLAF